MISFMVGTLALVGVVSLAVISGFLISDWYSAWRYSITEEIRKDVNQLQYKISNLRIEIEPLIRKYKCRLNKKS